ncbi:MAG: helix-turn-helix domain-containing protein [Acidimicrobiia bacterium]
MRHIDDETLIVILSQVMSSSTLVTSNVSESRSDDVEARILAGAMVCLERFGVAKTTLDDIAREADCSRATVYRYFPNRAGVVQAAVNAEIDRVADAIVASAAVAENLEDAVTVMFVCAARALVTHTALQRALDLEPEVVLPGLSFEGGDRMFAEAARRFAPVFARFVPSDRALRAAEWSTRVLLAYLHPDRAPFSMTDEGAARALVRRHIVPAFTPVPTVE